MLALVGARHIVHVSRIRVNVLEATDNFISKNKNSNPQKKATVSSRLFTNIMLWDCDPEVRPGQQSDGIQKFLWFFLVRPIKYPDITSTSRQVALYIPFSNSYSPFVRPLEAI